MSYPGYPNASAYPSNASGYPPSASGPGVPYPTGPTAPNPYFSGPGQTVFNPPQSMYPSPYPGAPYAPGPTAGYGGQQPTHHHGSAMPQINSEYGLTPGPPPTGFLHSETQQHPQMPMPMSMPVPQHPQPQTGYLPSYQQPYPGAPTYQPPSQHQVPSYPLPPQHGHHPYPSSPAKPVVAAAAAASVVKKSEDEKDKKPTVKPVSDFNATVDSERLKKAMKGFGSDEKTITAILSTRSNSQRVIISATYKSLYGKDLIKELKGELSGNYEDLVIALMTPLPEYLANELHRAIRGAGTEESTLVQILCSANNLEMRDIREAYQKVHGKNLESAVANDTSGDLKRLLVTVIQGSRSENKTPNMEQCKADAEQLYKAGEGTWGTSESTFFSIFANRSYAELRKIDECYINKTGHSLEKAIKKEFSGYVQKGMKTILSVAHNKPAYFADVIQKSTKGLGTKEKVLIRVIATRCEIDLGFIKEQYKIKHGKNLEDVISSETSGDFKKLLLALCGRY